MRYAIISDVHANEAALKAVLADAQDAGADRIYCLGDVLGYGPDPIDTLQLVHDRVHVCLMGNHDAAACGVFPVEDFSQVAADVIKKHADRLSTKAIAWLKSLPYVCEGPGFACAHGDFSNPKEFNYILEADEAMLSWRARTEPLLFVGHSHRPGIHVLGPGDAVQFLEPDDFVLEEGKRYIVNVGSVGYPRSGKCRSYYCMYDDEKKSVSFHSLPFDIDSYRKKMSLLGLAEAPWLAERAAEREREQHKVRADADFGKDVQPQRGFRVQARTTQSTARSSEPHPSAANVHGRGALATTASDGDNSNQSRNLVIILCTLLIVFAGVFCTMRLINAMPDHEEKKQIERIQIQSVAAPQPPAAQQVSSAQQVPSTPTSDVGQIIPLFGGWEAHVKDSSRQKVLTKRNEKMNVLAFHIENDSEATVRFTRKMSLFEKPQKIYADVELLTKPPTGVKSDFKFCAKLEFFKDNGKSCGQSKTVGGKLKMHAKDKVFDVPTNAVTAVFTLDCTSVGTHEIAKPYLSTKPPAATENPPAKPPPKSAGKPAAGKTPARRITVPRKPSPRKPNSPKK